MTTDERDQLRGVVSLWLTNGNKPVEAGNDTRYDFFRSGYCEAVFATESLVEAGMLALVGDCDTTMVVPTAKGVGEFLR